MNAAVLGAARHWSWIRNIALAAFLLLILFLIIRQARTIAWNEVGSALQAYRSETLLQSSVLGVIAYGLYGVFDLIGIQYIKARVSAWRTLGIAFVAYAINQSFGSLLGTVGMRLRLYGKLGLSRIAISKLIGLAIVTNWLGYLLVAGGLFAAGLIRLPDTWRIGNGALQAIGIVMLLLVAGYIAMCRFSRTRSISIRSEKIVLPTAGQALAQVAIATLHWFAIAGILYLLMHGQISYSLVLGAYMLTSISAVIAHVPGGIGVVEAVFVAVLSSRMPVSQLLAAILAFRGIFYVGALLLAGSVYLLLESRSARADAHA